jgi:hypothetical protein
VDQANIQIGGTALVTVSLNNVPSTGYTSAEFTCAYVSSLLEVSDVVPASLFGANVVTAMNNPQSGVFIFAIAGSNGNKATTSGTAFTFNVKGLSSGQTALECTARVSTGDNVLTALPSVGTSLSILEALPTPTDTTVPSTIEPPTATPSITPFPSATPIPGWLTFTDVTYSFQFQYPPQGQIQADSNDANTRINDLPIAQPGTNLTHKFMDVLVGQNVTECKSLQVQDPGVTVTINGIPFLKQTGDQGAAGSFFQLVEYSTQRDGVCVNLEFVLQSHDPSSFPTPPPVYDYATETALFDQIVGTYMWLAVSPTATFTSTPAVTSTPAESPTPTFTSTPFDSPTPDTSPTVVTPTMTPTVSPTGMIIGKAIASKPVTISVYDSNNALIVSVPVSQDGSFAVTLSGGTYTVVASASGCLSTQGSFSVTSDFNSTLPTITLSAGDIDNNNIIDQFDAMTIGMSYNTADPVSADLNSDGVINVLDLELLARNYRMTGPIVWQ